MMGTKIREPQPLPMDTSLEDLVPSDNFYRDLERRLDLSFELFTGLVHLTYKESKMELLEGG